VNPKTLLEWLLVHPKTKPDRATNQWVGHTLQRAIADFSRQTTTHIIETKFPQCHK